MLLDRGDEIQAQASREIAAIAAARPKLVMRNYRFIRKDGQIVDTSIVRKRFFESALQSGAGPVRATRIWNDMLFGDSYARQLIEKVCEIEVVDADAGFGFLE